MVVSASTSSFIVGTGSTISLPDSIVNITLVQALSPSFSLISLGGNSSPFEPTRLSCVILNHRIITKLPEKLKVFGKTR
jgi:hypothetical protein